MKNTRHFLLPLRRVVVMYTVGSLLLGRRIIVVVLGLNVDVGHMRVSTLHTPRLPPPSILIHGRLDIAYTLKQVARDCVCLVCVCVCVFVSQPLHSVFLKIFSFGYTYRSL